MNNEKKCKLCNKNKSSFKNGLCIQCENSPEMFLTSDGMPFSFSDGEDNTKEGYLWDDNNKKWIKIEDAVKEWMSL